MNWHNGVLLAVGILGIVNFIIDCRAKKLNWHKYLILTISILLIAESLLDILNPELLHKIFN